MVRMPSSQRFIEAFGRMLGNPELPETATSKSSFREVCYRVAPEEGRFRLSLSDFNAMALAFGFTPATQHFFDYYFRNALTIDAFEAATKRFQVDAFLICGHFQLAYRALATSRENVFWADISKIKPRLSVDQFTSRIPFTVEDITVKDSLLLNHLVWAKLALTHKSVTEMLMDTSDDARCAELASNLDHDAVRFLDLKESDAADSKDYLSRIADTLMKLVKKRAQVLQTAERNTDQYWALPSIDLYTAGSCRTQNDIEDFHEFLQCALGSLDLAPMHLRYFDSRLCFSADHMAHKLLRAVMLRRATLALFYVSQSDVELSSEVAAALAAGKYVIIYVPVFVEGESKHFEINKMAASFRMDSPTGWLGLDVRSGAAQGVLVVRDIGHCVTLIKRILTGELSFEIEERDHLFCLIEQLTGCVSRIAPSNPQFSVSLGNRHIAQVR